MQTLGPCPGPTESECAVEPGPQVIHVHMALRFEKPWFDTEFLQLHVVWDDHLRILLRQIPGPQPQGF